MFKSIERLSGNIKKFSPTPKIGVLLYTFDTKY